MRVIVTGAGGFIGRHTVKGLLEKGYAVTAVDLKTESLQKFSKNNKCLIEKRNILDRDFKDLIAMGDKVLHLAAIPHFVTEERVVDTIRVNVAGTANVVISSILKKAERIVYSSTGSVYAKDVEVPIRENSKLGPSADNYYGWTKKQSEEWIKNFRNQLPYVILRYAYVYGAFKDWGAIGKWIYHDIPKGKPPVIFGGDQTNDFIYVKDVVEANILALESKYRNQIYNIGTGRATSIRDTCECCIKAMETNLKMRIEPARTFDYPIFLYDISKARSLLRFQPKWNVLDGIKDMVQDLKVKS